MALAPTVSSCLSFGWETFKKRPGLFVGSSLLVMVLALALGMLEAMVGAVIGQDVVDHADPIISFVFNIFSSVGMLMLYLKAHDDIATVDFSDLWQPKYFWRFFGVTLLTSLCVIAGIIALIVPGIIIGLALSFAGPLVLDRNLGVIQTLQESLNLTKGHRMMLFKLALMSALINVLGLLALIVGVFVTMPVTMLAFIYAYRSITGKGTDIESIIVPEPELEVTA